MQIPHQRVDGIVCERKGRRDRHVECVANVPPHPNPLPLGGGEGEGSARTARTSGPLLRLGGGAGEASVRSVRTGAPPLPRRGGEGRGEGAWGVLSRCATPN